MQPRSIMKRSAFKTRRQILLYILVSILILGVVMGFTDPFSTDSAIHKASVGETIVMEQEPPADGTPADYDLISNLKFAAYKLHHSSFFRGETNGTAQADLGITTYTQYIHNTRVADANGVVFAETISTSSLKSLAEQKYAQRVGDNAVIIYRPSTSVNGTSATYSDNAYLMTYEQYSEKYGTIPDQLSKYVINENTIIGVKDENAPESDTSGGALTSSDSDNNGFDFIVPDKLVKGADGYYTYTLTLDPEASSVYYRNEVRTLGGADQNPKFYAVQLTIVIDDEWNPISVSTVENYDIAIPVLGAMNCTGRLTEVFTEINCESAMPEEDFFAPYVELALSNPDFITTEIPTGPSSPADYLATAFADYITGAKDLELTADITTDALSAYGLKLSLNLASMNVQAMLGDLYVKYAGDKVYLNLNNINGYVNVSDLNKFMSDGTIAPLLGDVSAVAATLDIASIFGGDILDVVFENCEMTSDSGITRIRMPFSLDLSSVMPEIGTTDIDASIYIKDEDMSLQAIEGIVKLGDVAVSISAKPPVKAFKFPATDGATDLSGVLDFLPSIVKTATSNTYGINGSVSAMGQTFDISAYIDRTDVLTVDATVTVLGQQLSVKMLDENIYVGLGNIDVRGTINDLPELFDAVKILVGADMSALSGKLSLVMPSSLDDFIDMLDNLSVKNDTLTVGLNVLASPASLMLTRANGELTGLKFDFDFDKFGIRFDAHADLDISTPKRYTVAAPDGNDFLTFGELAAIAVKLEKYFAQDVNYSVEMNGKVTVGNTNYPIIGNAVIDTITAANSENSDIAVRGTLTALGQDINIIYVDGTAYFDLKSLAFKLTSSDARVLQSSALKTADTVLGMFTAPDTQTLISNLVGMIDMLTVDGDIIKINLNGEGINITVELDVENNNIRVSGTVSGYPIDLGISLSLTQEAHTIIAPENADDHIDAVFFGDMLDTLSNAIERKGLTADLTVDLDGGKDTMTLALSLSNNTVALNISETEYGLDLTVVGNNAYITLGDIKAVGDVNDLKTLIDTITPLLPQSLTDKLYAAVDNFDLVETFNSMLDALSVKQAYNGDLQITFNCDGITSTITVPSALNYAYVDLAYGGNNAVISVRNITPASVKISEPNAAQYVRASELIKVLSPIAPFAGDAISAQAVSLGIDGQLNGYINKGSDETLTQVQTTTEVNGSVYIDLSNGLSGIAIQADLNLGDLPMSVIIKDGALYMAVNTNSDKRIALSSQLSEEALDSILTGLDAAIPGIKAEVLKIIQIIKDTTVKDVIGMISLAPDENGFTLALDAASLGVYAEMLFATDDERFTALDVACTAFGLTFGLSLEPTVNDLGALTGFTAGGTELYDITLSLDGKARENEITVASASKYVPIRNITTLIPPILSLADDFGTAKAIELDLDALALISNNKQTEIGGKVAINFDPLAINANLTLFKGTGADSETELDIIYTDGIAYIRSGNIKLSFDTQNDIDTLLSTLYKYLPDYIVDELAKLLGKKEGTSALSNIMLITERIDQIAATDDISNIIGILFSPLGNISASGTSTIKSLFDMVSIFERDATASVATEKETVFTVSFLGYEFNITPHVTTAITESGTVSVIETASVDTNIGSIYVRIDVNKFTPFNETLSAIAAPSEAELAEYVSVIKFIQSVDNAINTFTATNERYDETTGETFEDITFEVDNFEYDYYIYTVETDENGNPVKDSAGRNQPLKDINGNKVIDKHVVISRHDIDGQETKSLKVKFEQYLTADGNGDPVKKYRLNLEAHITLDIGTACTFDGNGDHMAHDSGNTMPIDLDLYVINNDDYPDGFAFIDYMESSNLGERISIDYTSVMEIAAAVMDILGVRADITEQLLGDYRQTIDTTVFKSMSIAGLGDLTAALESMVDAANHGTTAMSYISDAWDIFCNVDTAYANRYDGDTAVEKLNSALPDIKVDLMNAITELKTAAELLGADIGSDESEDLDKITTINGELYNKIVNGVSFTNDETQLRAIVNNSLVADTDGVADVTVKQSNGRLTSVTVNGLDVNTAKLEVFSAPFSAGGSVDISLPSDFDQKVNANGKSADYSNFADIKYLLFDVMNTANLMQFEMGDINSTATDKIRLNLNIIKIINITPDIYYNIKVKILDCGENANPRYKTVAVVELKFKDVSMSAIPDCTTRLYFVDDMIYVDGLEWYYTTSWLGTKSWKTRNVRVAYSVDEFTSMVSNDIDTFMFQFLFYLMPLSRNLVFNDLQQIIVNEVNKSYDKSPTLAKVFKGYSYTDDNDYETTHTMVIGLEELSGNANLNDLTLSLTGANDDKNSEKINILDNYISKAWINTSFLNSSLASISLTLDATLKNVDTHTVDGVSHIYSRDLTATTLGTALSDRADLDLLNEIRSIVPISDWQRIWAA